MAASKVSTSDDARVSVTPAEFRELRRSVEQAKWLSFTVLRQLIGKDKAEEALEKLCEWIDDPFRRFGRGTPVYGATDAYQRLVDADLYTLEEVAAKPRAEVEAIKGVGPATMSQLEEAMAEHGLNFAEAS